MKEKIKNFLIGEKNSVACLWIFLILGSLFFLGSLLQFLWIGLSESSVLFTVGRIIDILIMACLFLIPLLFLALLSGVILGNRDKRHILLTIILGIIMATVISNSILTASTFTM